MAEPMVITSLGLKKLEEELEYLVVVRRKEIAENIKQDRKSTRLNSSHRL